jgi:acyl-CoA synthetase (AMP-forming)/AMP-acid ligase II
MLMAGGKVVINRKVDTSEILRLIQDERCTHINLVPDLYDWLRQDPHFEDYNLSSLKLLTYSGSAFRPGQLSQCVKTFWKRFAQSYGSMETAGSSITALSSEDHILEGPGSNLLASAGKPLNAAKVKIVDRHAKFVKAGEISAKSWLKAPVS